MRMCTPGPKKRLFVLFALLLLALCGAPIAHRYLRAVSFLTRFSNPQATGAIARYAEDAVSEQLDTSSEGFRIRYYNPTTANAPGIVLVHGVHRKGVDEPRLVRFARTMAATGFTVLTPEINELIDYKIDAASIATIGTAAHALHEKTGKPVGIIGLSFAGGLSLLAAADQHYAEDVGWVLTVGAHDSLSRVSNFFADNRVMRVDGTEEEMHAHDYGTLVLAYSDVPRFFSQNDAEVAHDTMKLLLWEEFDAARGKAKMLSPLGQTTMQVFLDHKTSSLAGEIHDLINARAQEMSSVSPHEHLGTLRVPTFVLHGSTDSVIPPTEAAWLGRDIPSDALREVLVSPVLSHVEFQGEPSWVDRWALVHFMAEVIEAAEGGNA